MGLSNGAPPTFAGAVCAARVLSPASAISVDVCSSVSYRTSEGESSHIRSRRASTSSYGSVLSKISDSALGSSSVILQVVDGVVITYRIIFQSSRAAPGGGTAARPSCERPSVFTHVVDFSVYAEPGRHTSASCAPRSPWWP
jgi:hypothetical protein